MEKMNEFLSVDSNQTTNFNKDIVLSDLNGNQEIVVKCYCTIVAGKSISYYMDVLNTQVFESQKIIIQEQIEIFKKEAEQLAINNNVPII
ncbi:MAG: hypothetical protein ACRCX8_05890 [Sarcina sp.]